MIVLGIIAVIAIVGLVLLFVQHKNNSVTGQIYGGDIIRGPFPYWENEGVPRNIPEMQWANQVSNKVAPNQWGNYQNNPKGNPISNIPSVMKKCGVGGFLVPYNDLTYYQGRGYTIQPTQQHAGACVFPPGTMVGGTV